MSMGHVLLIIAVCLAIFLTVDLFVQRKLQKEIVLSEEKDEKKYTYEFKLRFKPDEDSIEREEIRAVLYSDEPGYSDRTFNLMLTDHLPNVGSFFFGDKKNFWFRIDDKAYILPRRSITSMRLKRAENDPEDSVDSKLPLYRMLYVMVPDYCKSVRGWSIKKEAKKRKQN